MQRVQDIGCQIRMLRMQEGLTQSQLATAARVSRTTLKQLETGLLFEVGLAKILRILGVLGQHCVLRQGSAETDYIALACTAASVSFKTMLPEKDLIRAFLTGAMPKTKRPHVRALMEEGSDELRTGLFAQIGAWTTPRRLRENVAAIAKELGITAEEQRRWIELA